MQRAHEYATIGQEVYFTIQDKLSHTDKAWKPVREPFIEHICNLLEDVIRGSPTLPARNMRKAIEAIYGSVDPQQTRHVCDLTKNLLLAGPVAEEEERRQYDRLAQAYRKFYELMEQA